MLWNNWRQKQLLKSGNSAINKSRRFCGLLWVSELLDPLFVANEFGFIRSTQWVRNCQNGESKNRDVQLWPICDQRQILKLLLVFLTCSLWLVSRKRLFSKCCIKKFCLLLLVVVGHLHVLTTPYNLFAFCTLLASQKKCPFYRLSSKCTLLLAWPRKQAFLQLSLHLLNFLGNLILIDKTGPLKLPSGLKKYPTTDFLFLFLDLFISSIFLWGLPGPSEMSYWNCFDIDLSQCSCLVGADSYKTWDFITLVSQSTQSSRWCEERIEGQSPKHKAHFWEQKCP